MERRGVFAPTTIEEAREQYDTAGPAAQVVVRETAKAMELPPEEYDERVDGDVIETARDAIFASLLAVHVGDREEFDEWLAAEDVDDEALTLLGSEHVENVVWHDARFADAVVAATFQNEPEAAVATLRRNAFGRVYADRLQPGE
ncbi:DUF5809 family protein [Haloparvum sp. PAK95]|uniref:DUF5809 family protein n=1 Tax=Haloparvum sp. PAK95 TaxID=3418962 RepID=UPI003D2ECDF5